MTWVRWYAKKLLGPYMGHLSQEKALKYLNISRMIYFISAATLGVMTYSLYKEQNQAALESGQPVIEDHSKAHEFMRTSGSRAGIIYQYTKGKGMEVVEFNKDEYYQQLEKESYEKAKRAQEKALSEGKKLPKDAIKLV